MAWTKSATTKHTCGGPVFGRKTPGCARCDELLGGAAPVEWAGARRERELPSWARQPHVCRGSGCSADPLRNNGWTGGVCTFGDW